MKRILVTGSSRGIGRAIALRLAGPDSEIILHGRDRKALEQTSVEIEKQSGKATVIAADLSNTPGINELIERVSGAPLDILVNNAGLTVVKDADKLTDDDWARSFSVNVTAPFMLARALVPEMRRGASIVNILSTAATRGFSEWSSYCMSKFALKGFSLALREELRPRGIRVINICPAATDTEIWNNVPGKWDRESMMHPDEIAATVEYALNLPRSTQVEDITLGNVGGPQ